MVAQRRCSSTNCRSDKMVNMWIDWNNPGNVESLIIPDNTHQPFRTSASKTPKNVNNNVNKEFIDENKRLWMELKEKNDTIISLHDDIYYKEQELKQFAKCKLELEQMKKDENVVTLIKDNNKLKNDLQEKTSMINMLHAVVENLCEELQTENIERIEEEITRLRTANQKLGKENSDIKVKLKIVEHDNDKLCTRSQHLEDENHALKKRLDKATRRLKERENSLLNFKHFHELVNNLQTRISRSKNENQTMKNALEKMSNLANNYDKLDRENVQLKRDNGELKELLKELKTKNENLKNTALSLQQQQSKIQEDEAVSKPALIRENQHLKDRLLSAEGSLQNLRDTNVKLKENLTVYEKMLIESRAFIEKHAKQARDIKKIVDENENMRNVVQNLTQNLSHEYSNKNILLQEKERMAKMLEQNHAEKEDLLKELVTIRRTYEEAEMEINDLKRQLHVCKNTIHNQVAELDRLQQENKELRLNVKQYESQIQMDGKVYKLVR